MTVGPLAVAVSLTMTGHYAAMALEGVDPGLSKTLYNVGQVILQALGFAVIYKFVPSCRVHFSHALVGGAVVSVCGLVVKQLFGMWVTAGTLTNIYGAFVAIPVFVLWVYVAWYLFLQAPRLPRRFRNLPRGASLTTIVRAMIFDGLGHAARTRASASAPQAADS